MITGNINSIETQGIKPHIAFPKAEPRKDPYPKKTENSKINNNKNVARTF